MRTLRALRVFVVVLVLPGSTACKEHAKAAPAAQQETTWRKLGEWSGHGSVQTESFTSDSGFLRIHWKTAALPGATKPGHFVLAVHSSISGRLLEVAVDHTGPGENIAFVSQDPHVFFAKVESEGLEWSFSVEEGYSGPVVVGR